MPQKYHFQSNGLLALTPTLALLSACTVVPTGNQATFAGGPPQLQERGQIDIPGRRVFVVRNPQNGNIALVSPGTTMNLVLPGFRDARIMGVWRSGSDTDVALAGPTLSCPLQYVVVAVGPTSGTVAPVGACGANFAIRQLQNGSLSAQQTATADPIVWSFANRRLAGPVLRSSLTSRRLVARNQPNGRPLAPPPPAAQDQIQDGQPATTSVGTLQRLGPDAGPQPVTDQESPTKDVPIVTLDGS
jgi:hypothetical protein